MSTFCHSYILCNFTHCRAVIFRTVPFYIPASSGMHCKFWHYQSNFRQSTEYVVVSVVLTCMSVMTHHANYFCMCLFVTHKSFAKCLFKPLLLLLFSTNPCQTLVKPHGLYVACQAPLSVGYSRQEYWSGLHFPSPGIFPTQGSDLHLLCRQVDSLLLSHQENFETFTHV